MIKYKVIFGGEEQDEVLDTEEEAEEYCGTLINYWHKGGEILELSNPGDYSYNPDDVPECEVIETEEE